MSHTSSLTSASPRRSGHSRHRGSSTRVSKAEDDSDEEDVIQCRICHDDKSEPVVSPCHCKGTLGLVHLTCLQRWLTEARRSHCELCGARYAMQRRLHRSAMRSMIVWSLTPHACTRPRLHLTGRRMLSSDVLTVVVALPVLFVLFWACVMLADYYTPTPLPRNDDADVRGGSRKADEMAIGTSAIGARFIVFMLMLIEIVSLVCFCYWVMLVIRKQVHVWYFWWQHDVVVTVVAEPVDPETYRRSVVLERRRRPSDDSPNTGADEVPTTSTKGLPHTGLESTVEETSQTRSIERVEVPARRRRVGVIGGLPGWSGALARRQSHMGRGSVSGPPVPCDTAPQTSTSQGTCDGADRSNRSERRSTSTIPPLTSSALPLLAASSIFMRRPFEISVWRRESVGFPALPMTRLSDASGSRVPPTSRPSAPESVGTNVETSDSTQPEQANAPSEGSGPSAGQTGSTPLGGSESNDEASQPITDRPSRSLDLPQTPLTPTSLC